MRVATQSGCEHCPADGGGCPVCDMTEGTQPVKPAVIFGISIRFAGQWFPLSRGYHSRQTAEWEVRRWQDTYGAHGATFRIQAEGVAEPTLAPAR